MPEFVKPFSGMVPPRKLSDRELARGLRLSLSAEEEAVHLYEALADATDNEIAKAVLQDIANEEKVHKGEFQKLIEILFPKEIGFMNEGAAEVIELLDSIKKEPKSKSEKESTLTVGNLKVSS